MMSNTTVRQETDVVKLQADALFRDGLPLTLTQIAARYYMSRDTARRRFLDVEPDAMRGRTQLYRPETILRVMGRGDD